MCSPLFSPVRETKSTFGPNQRRGTENIKINYARRYFATIEVDYADMVPVDWKGSKGGSGPFYAQSHRQASTIVVAHAVLGKMSCMQRSEDTRCEAVGACLNTPTPQPVSLTATASSSPITSSSGILSSLSHTQSCLGVPIR